MSALDDASAQLMAKYGVSPNSGEDPSAALLAKYKDAIVTDPSFLDRAQALASGINKGVPNLVGLPINTLVNVANLARAAYGAAGHATGLLKAEEMPELLDPAKYVGSAEWLASKVPESLKSAITPNRPNDVISRVLYGGGQGVVPSMLGSPSAAAAAKAGTLGSLSSGVGEVTAEMGASPATQTLATLATYGAGNKAANLASAREEMLANRRAANAVRDQNINEVQGAGYVLPPTQANLYDPGVINRLAEGFAGKLTTQQQARVANNSLTDELSRKSINVAPDSPITSATLQNVRNQAGTAYDAASKFGPMSVYDPGGGSQYFSTLGSMWNNYQATASQFKSLRIPEVEQLFKDASKTSFTSEGAIELIKRLRQDGFKNMDSEDPANVQVGRTQLGVQNALEDLMVRRMQEAGQPELASDYQNARTQIAKTYSIENALNEATGHVDATKLAAQWRNGAPLSDDLLLAAKAGSILPLATKELNTSIPGVSPLDYAWGLGSLGVALASGHPEAMPVSLVPLARPLVRSAILSAPYQRMMVGPSDYSMGNLAQLAKFGLPTSPIGAAGLMATEPTLQSLTQSGQ